MSARSKGLKTVRAGTALMVAAVLIALIAPIEALSLPAAVLFAGGGVCIMIGGALYWFSKPG